jgi:2-dehydropantoate 2-reductase
MMRTDAITVIGAGGIGCAVGHALLTAGVKVNFVDADAAKVDAGNRSGVDVTNRPSLPAQFVHFAEWQPNPEQLHLVCTKCYDNAAVFARLPADTPLVPIQNGFDAAIEKLGHSIEGIASFVSECEPGRPATRITRAGDLHLGGRGALPPAWLHELALQLRQAKLFRVIEVADIGPIKHAKLMYNAAISPLAAAAGMDNGQLLTLPQARRLFFAFLRENHAILKAANKPLGKVGPFHPDTVMRILARPWVAQALARAFVPGLRGTYCSMSGDIEKGRTEISNYNGQLIAWAGSTPCPLNRRAVEVIERMSRERLRPNVQALSWFDVI